MYAPLILHIYSISQNIGYSVWSSIMRDFPIPRSETLTGAPQGGTFFWLEKMSSSISVGSAARAAVGLMKHIQRKGKLARRWDLCIGILKSGCADWGLNNFPHMLLILFSLHYILNHAKRALNRFLALVRFIWDIIGGAKELLIPWHYLYILVHSPVPRATKPRRNLNYPKSAYLRILSESSGGSKDNISFRPQLPFNRPKHNSWLVPHSPIDVLYAAIHSADRHHNLYYPKVP